MQIYSSPLGLARAEEDLTGLAHEMGYPDNEMTRAIFGPRPPKDTSAEDAAQAYINSPAYFGSATFSIDPVTERPCAAIYGGLRRG